MPAVSAWFHALSDEIRYGARARLLLAWLGLTASLCILFSSKLSLPPSGDEPDYFARALLISKGHWLAAFNDAYRPPLYPTLLAPFFYLSVDPAALIRVIQLALVSGAAILCWRTAQSARADAPVLQVGAVLVAGWVPFGFFATRLLAEACSHLLTTLLMLRALTTPQESCTSRRNCLIQGSLLASLTLLKANQLLFLVPVSGVLVLRAGIRSGLTAAARTVAIVLLLLAPWLAFTSSVTGRPQLTTSLGINLLLGTGTVELANDAESASLPHTFAVAHALAESSTEPSATERASIELGRIEQNDYFRDRALQVWRSKPGIMLEYALAKVAHAHGGSLRDVRDLSCVALLGLTVLSILFCWGNPQSRKWLVWCLSMTLAGTIMTAAFLPDQRFKTIYFDQAALFVLANGIVRLWEVHQARRRTVRI